MPHYVHKRFRRLAAYVSQDVRATWPFRQLLCTRLTEYYSTFLRGPSFDGIHSINLRLTSLMAENGRMERVAVGYLDYYLLVDFHLLTDLGTDQERQLYLLTIIHYAMRQLVQQEGWEMERFERAYQACKVGELPVEIRY